MDAESRSAHRAGGHGRLAAAHARTQKSICKHRRDGDVNVAVEDRPPEGQRTQPEVASTAPVADLARAEQVLHCVARNEGRPPG